MPRSWIRLQFTFTHPDDVEKYGDQPYLYDEPALAGMSARDLAALEKEIGQPIVGVLNDLRENRPLANLFLTWWALRRAGVDVDLDKYDPHTMMIEWEQPTPQALGKALDPGRPLPVLENVDTTVLPSLPAKA